MSTFNQIPASWNNPKPDFYDPNILLIDQFCLSDSQARKSELERKPYLAAQVKLKQGEKKQVQMQVRMQA